LRHERPRPRSPWSATASSDAAGAGRRPDVGIAHGRRAPGRPRIESAGVPTLVDRRFDPGLVGARRLSGRRPWRNKSAKTSGFAFCLQCRRRAVSRPGRAVTRCSAFCSRRCLAPGRDGRCPRGQRDRQRALAVGADEARLSVATGPAANSGGRSFLPLHPRHPSRAAQFLRSTSTIGQGGPRPLSIHSAPVRASQLLWRAGRAFGLGRTAISSAREILFPSRASARVPRSAHPPEKRPHEWRTRRSSRCGRQQDRTIGGRQ